MLTAAGAGCYALRETDGRIEFFNADGTLRYLQDSQGNRIGAGYSEGRLTSLTSFASGSASAGPALTLAYDASSGRVTSVTGSDGRSVQYTYDGNGQLRQVLGYDGLSTHFTYDDSGTAVLAHALTAIQFPDNTHEYFSYDSLGRVAGAALDGGASAVTFTYDFGHVTVSDAAQNATHYFFNEEGLLVKSVDPLGNATFAAYDDNFNVVSTTGPTGLIMRSRYDGRGNLTSITDPLGQTDRFTYTAANLLASNTDPQGNTTIYRYDAAGNHVATQYADGTIRTATYDATGNPLSMITRNGQVIASTYDPATGQLISETLADGTTYTFGYDNHGNVISATDGTDPIVLSYDSGNQLTHVAYPHGRALTYTYDSGRRKSMVDQDGNTVNYTYDSAGRLASLTDGNGAPIVTYTYNNLGQLVLAVDGAGVDNRDGTYSSPYTTYQYDAAGHLLHLVNYASGTTVNSRFDYTYDSLGQTTAMATLDGTWTYRYDSAGQLVHALFASTNPLVSDQDLLYVYNAAGNRTQTMINGSTANYASNVVNEYTSTSDGTNYTYDADGNLLSKTNSSGTTTYTYDALDRLTSVTSPTERYVYEYDAIGNLAATIRNGDEVTSNLVDPTGAGRVVHQYDAAGSSRAQYIYGLGLVSQVTAAGTNFYQFDALGSTASLISAAGTIQNSYRYLPFGGILEATGNNPNPFTFVGRFGVSSDGSGLLHMQARRYDPATGQFVSNDPIGLASGDTNLRRYVGNQPVGRIDPSGLRWWFGRPETVGNQIVWERDVDEYTEPPGSAGESGSTNLDHPICPVILLHEDSKYYPDGRPHIKTHEEWHVLSNQANPKQNPVDSEIGSCFAAASSAKLAGDWDYYDNQVQKINELRHGNNYGDNPGYEHKEPDVRTGQRPRKPSASGQSQAVQSVDPNALLGPAGYGPEAFVAPGTLLPYEIDFENDATATAPAQFVTITQPLDPSLDPNTFQLTQVAFGDTVFVVPPENGWHYETTVSMTYHGETFDVAVTAGIDLGTPTVYAYLQSLRADGSGLPPSVLTGFLPPEDGSGRGMGRVNYTIRAKPARATGTEIRNVAVITFDANAPIATDQIDPHDARQGIDPAKQALVTIDAGAPSSAVDPLPATAPSLDFTVTWGGNDDPGGSGIATYDVYVAVDRGDFNLWLPSTADTAATYPGVAGHQYAFYCVATDNVGNHELKAPTAEATVAVDVPPTVALASATTELPENTDTTNRSQVAAIVVTDDGLGTHVLSLAGPDASWFEIVGAGLYLKAATALDHETKPVLEVTVAVDDPALGATPDGTAPLTLSITDVNEPPVLAAVGDRVVDERRELSFTIAATDADLPAQTLTYDATGVPSGANFDPGTRRFAWTPATGQRGPYHVTFTATDDGTPSRYDTVVVTITVLGPKWQNWPNPYDVNNDTKVNTVDVLSLVNSLNFQGIRDLQTATPPTLPPPPYIDPSGDNRISTVDVLQLVNYLNLSRYRSAPGTPSGSGGAGDVPTAGEGETLGGSPLSAVSPAQDAVPSIVVDRQPFAYQEPVVRRVGTPGADAWTEGRPIGGQPRGEASKKVAFGPCQDPCPARRGWREGPSAKKEPGFAVRWDELEDALGLIAPDVAAERILPRLGRPATA